MRDFKNTSENIFSPRPLVIAAVFASLLFFASAAVADTIYLANGGRIEGEIIRENKEEIVVRRGSMEAVLPRKDIERIERTSVAKPADGNAGKTGLELAKQRYEEGDFRSAAKEYRKAKLAGNLSPEVEKMSTICSSLVTASDELARKHLREVKQALVSVTDLDPDNRYAKDIAAELEKYDKLLAEQGSFPGKPMVWRTKHFTIYHHQPYIASQVAEQAERNLKILVKSLTYDGCPKPKLKSKFTIRIYRDHDEYLANTPKLGGLFPAICVNKTTIVSDQQEILYYLRHELTHALLHVILPSMPIWVHEGFATGGYVQARSYVYTQAKAYITNKSFLPVDDLIAIKQIDNMSMTVDAYYMEARMLIEFLIYAGGGMKKFHEFGRTAREMMQKNVHDYVKKNYRGRGGTITVSNLDWIERPMRDLLESMYGYGDLKKLDEDLKAYIFHREAEARQQEKQAAKKLDAR